MKEMDGFAASKQIMTFDPRAKIIIVTNYDDAGLRQSARETGAFAYVVKENLLALAGLLKSMYRNQSPGCVE